MAPHYRRRKKTIWAFPGKEKPQYSPGIVSVSVRKAPVLGLDCVFARLSQTRGKNPMVRCIESSAGEGWAISARTETAIDSDGKRVERCLPHKWGNVSEDGTVWLPYCTRFRQNEPS